MIISYNARGHFDVENIELEVDDISSDEDIRKSIMDDLESIYDLIVTYDIKEVEV